MTKKLLSVVLPVYNESENIDWFYDELTATMKSIGGADYELVYVNDGSRDDTDSKIRTIAKKDKKIKYVCLARNFGKESATSAGIHSASGDAIIVLDGDGQHPPSVIPEMYRLWRDGVQHIVGIRTENKKAGFFKTSGSKLFYTLSKKFGASAILPNATDFRLFDKEVAEVFMKYTEKKRMTRALLDWSGFDTQYIDFVARDREHGTASYNLKSLLRLAINGYIGATLKPLYLVGLLGFIVTAISALALLFVVVNQYAYGDPLNLQVSGVAMIALFVTVLVGILLTCQGIVAVYVANIHLESQNRPLYIINKARSILHK